MHRPAGHTENLSSPLPSASITTCVSCLAGVHPIIGRRRCELAATALLLLPWLVFYWSGSAAAVVLAAGTTTTTTTVPVGVVLDLASDVGREGLAGISMALEYFYVKHPGYATRVGLHVKDSRGDPATAAHAAEDLIKNAKVQAIIVAPQTSVEADLFAKLGSYNHIPVLSFSGVSPTSRLHTVPFFVNAAPQDSFQVMPITSILTSFSGREVIMVCEDSPYGSGILQPLSDALQSNEVHMIDSVLVPIGVADYHLDQVLYHLKEMPTRLFIVHMRPVLSLHLFFRAKSAGMITEDYVWIATAALGNVVDSLSPDELDYLQRVVTLRPYVQAIRNVNNLSARFKARFNLESPDIDHVHNPSLLLFWAYDTAWATATAAEIAGLSRSYIWMAETDLDRYGVDATRRALMDSILNIAFDGLAGKFKLVNGELELPSYEIVNVTNKGVVGIGLWTPLTLLPENLGRGSYSFGNSRSGSGTVNPVFSRDYLVLNPKVRDKTDFTLKLNPESRSRNTRKLTQGVSDKVCGSYTNKPLRIGVPQKDGFKTFVNISHPYFFCKDNGTRPSTTKQVTGYVIDVFEAAMKKLQDPLCYVFCVFDGSYDELVGNVSLGNLDGAAGDVTITVDRIGKVDFTMPYTQSGVSMLVLSKSDLEPIQWTFLAPLTKELWFATVGFFFFTGFVVWVIERPRNPEYQGSSLRQFSTALYFAFSTLTFSHGHILRSSMSKIVVVIWCFAVLVLVQSYTASFSSILTAGSFHPSVTYLDQLLLNHDRVGYQRNSFVYSMLRNRGFSKNRLIPYSNEDEYAEALRKGSVNGGVSAIVDEVPYLTSFLFSDTRYQNEFQIVDHVYKTPGLGFVFPQGFPLLHNISTAILNITEGNEGSQIEEKWLGRAAARPTVSNTPSTPLTLQSFSGLFLTSGFISSLMLLISVARLVHARWTEARYANAQSMDISTHYGESHPLQTGPSNIPSLDQPYTEANHQDFHRGSRAAEVVVTRSLALSSMQQVTTVLSVTNLSMKRQVATPTVPVGAQTVPVMKSLVQSRMACMTGLLLRNPCVEVNTG